MNTLAFINWDFQPEIISSPIKIVYYGLCWALAFLIGNYLMGKIMKNDNAPDEYSEKILIYALLGGVIGARMGHILFYHLDYYLANPLDIIKIWEGGLASHGGVLGLLIANYIYSKRVSKRSFTWSADKIVVVAGIGAALIRFGNLTNSEILGVKSESETAFFFEQDAKRKSASYFKSMENENMTFGIQLVGSEIEPNGNTSQIDDFNYPQGDFIAEYQIPNGVSKEQVEAFSRQWHYNFSENYFNPVEDHIMRDSTRNVKVIVSGNKAKAIMPVLMIPRIPAQLWEAIVYIFIFIFMMLAYWKWKWYLYDGLLFGTFMVLQFTSRFIIEYWKEIQADDVINAANEGASGWINRGQQLSIPAVLIGIIFIVWAVKSGKKDTKITLENS